MYQAYWGLSRAPFSGNARDFYYESPVHEEAAARLWYLIEQRRRCGLLTGLAGTGKSTLLTVLADQLNRTGRRVVQVDLGSLSGEEFLWQLNADFGLFPGLGDSPPVLWRRLQDHLYGLSVARLSTVFVFDNVDRAAEDCGGYIQRLVRHESRLPSTTTTLLAGRACPTWKPLADLPVELDRLDRRHTALYVRNATQSAGAARELFDDSAIERVFVRSRGVPRDINRLADLALLAGMSLSRQIVDADAVATAEAMMDGSAPETPPSSRQSGFPTERFAIVET